MPLKTTRKATRRVGYNVIDGWVQPAGNFPKGQYPGATVVASLDDAGEPDRYVHLVLDDDAALRLAAKLALQVGYKLVPA